jgi:prepilin-type N-terminal cleavage/methylation domain-containing protein
MKYKEHNGFTLVELLVAISIIGLLSLIVYASFGSAREQTRDKARFAKLKEVQLAIERYKAQNGVYPSAGCTATAAQFAGPGSVSGAGFVACTAANTNQYIAGLAPDYIDELPLDSQFETEVNRGYFYRSNGVSYKLMLLDVAEEILIGAYTDEFARCPRQMASGPCSGSVPTTTYAVYSLGAEDW